MRDPRTAPVSRPARGPFERILCAAIGEGGLAAIEQARALAGAEDTVTFLADAADEALLVRAAERAGSVTQLLGDADPLDALLEAAPDYDLVVTGPPRMRPAGIVRQDPGTHLLHRSPIPVLVARERPLASGVLAATDGRPGARPALTAAARIAAWVEAELTVLHVRERDEDARRNELMAELDGLRAHLGREPRYTVDFGAASTRILAAAAADAPGLVVVGSGAKTGIAALASTSERVAHAAPCSVLVLRERAA